MTCIVGLLCSDGKIYMGADSAASEGASVHTVKTTKVFRNGPFLIGYTSSFRMGQLLQYEFEPPTRDPDDDALAYMVKDAIPAMRKCLKDGGYTKAENNVETGGVFLVGYEGRLFRIDSDFHVGEPLQPYTAIGSGEDIALGSIYSTHGTTITSRERILKALNAAQEFKGSVREPFNVECLTLPHHLRPPRSLRKV